jgi:hypothetical protein
MKNLFDISSEEKNRILEMHVKATKKQYLKEDTTPNYTNEEADALVQVMNTKMNEILEGKLSDTLSNMKLKGQFTDEGLSIFRIVSTDTDKFGLSLRNEGSGYVKVTIGPNKQKAIGSVDISADLETIKSSLTDRQKEIMGMDIPGKSGYTFNNVLTDYKPTMALQGLDDNEGTMFGEMTYTNGNYAPSSACLGIPNYTDMGSEFPAKELIKLEADGNQKYLKICYGGLKLNNNSIYLRSNKYPFTTMINLAAKEK